jgi:hypothetical protein
MKSMKRKHQKDLQIISEIEKKTNLVSLLTMMFFFGGCSVIGYFNLQTNPSSLLFFQKPLKTISNLSLIGFSISGLLMGMGVFLCDGGFLYHTLCGIPSLAKESFLIIFLFLIFLVVTEATKEKTMGWLFKTEPYYVDHVDDYLYFSIGFSAFIFILLLIFCFVLIMDSKQLRRLYGEERGKYIFK